MTHCLSAAKDLLEERDKHSDPSTDLTISVRVWVCGYNSVGRRWELRRCSAIDSCCAKYPCLSQLRGISQFITTPLRIWVSAICHPKQNPAPPHSHSDPPHPSPLLSLHAFTFNPPSLQTSVFHSTLLKGLPRMSNSSVLPPFVWFFSWTVLQFCLWIAPLSQISFFHLLRTFSVYCKLGNQSTLETDDFTYCRTRAYLDRAVFNNILF